MSEPYLTAKITAWAILNNKRFDDVISVSATFALNTIPTASVVLAVGKNADEKIATIHTWKEEITARAPAEIYVKISNMVGERIGMVEGTYKVFEGYVAGIGYQRSHNHANYVVHLVHWLDDLNNSSAINGNWFPGVPHDWAQQAVVDRIGENGAIGAGGLIPSVSSKFANSDSIKTDLWKKTVKPLLAKIAGFSGDGEQEKYAGGTLAGETNSAANNALKRMPGDGPYVPLGLKLSGGGLNLENSIAIFFSNTIGSSFVQNSMWSKLLNDYAAQFLFAISPAVEWATPIPFCAGLRFSGDAKEITAKEYAYANFTANMSQLLEAVYIHYPAGSATNVPNDPLAGNARLSFYKPWAQFPEANNPDVKKGLKLFKTAPGWLANLDPATITALTAGIGVYDFTATRSGKTLPAGAVGTKTAHEQEDGTILNFAKHWYLTEILQQRYGEFSGPLRFDIAPGSIIKIHTPPRDQDLEEDNPYVIASVMSVAYVINSERATAGTSFTIAHTKTEKENTDDLYSTPSPPLYKEAWYGGPLAKPK